MSVKVSEAVWGQAECSQTAMLVLLVLADYASDDGACFPSVDTIAGRARMSTRTVQRALNELEQKGSIERRERGGRKTTEYVVLVGRTGDNESGRQSVGATPGARGATPGARGVTPRAPRGDNDGAQNRHEPSVEPSEEPSGAALVAPNAQTLVAEWIDHSNAKPPQRVIGQMAREIKALLDEGYAYADVRGAVADWSTRGLAPSVLPSILNDRLNGGPSHARRGGRLTPTERAQQTLAIGAAMAAAQNPRLEIAR